MKKILGLESLAFVLLVSPAWGGDPAPTAASESKLTAAESAVVTGEVVSVEGIVFIRPDGKESAGGLKPAKPGDRITAGDVVNTSSHGRVKILMKDKSIVDLGPSALFKVDSYKPNSGSDRQLDVSMMYGTMRAAVPQKITGPGRFKVRTPTATMGVRGTEFIVKSDIQNTERRGGPGNGDKPAGKTEVTVVQGKVDVAKPQISAGAPPPPPVALTAGMQISSQQGDKEMTKPITLDKTQMTQLTQVAKMQDNTFAKAVIIDLGPQNQGSSPSGGADRGPAASAAAGATGEITRQVIAATIAAAPPPPVNVNVFPGSPDIHQILNSGPANPLAGMRRLRVIVNIPN